MDREVIKKFQSYLKKTKLDECKEPYNNRHVMGFYKYTKLLEETVSAMECDYYDECIQKCIDSIIADAGSLNYDDVFRTARENDNARIMADYLKDKANEVISEISQEGKLYVKNIDSMSKTQADRFVKKALKAFANDIAMDVLKQIEKENELCEKAK